MKHSGLRFLILLSALALGSMTGLAADPATDQEIFNQAKILMFDLNWEGAREMLQRLIRDFPRSGLVPQAYFHSAHCLRMQRKPEEALRAYDQFLQKYPNEPFFAGEARQAAVELAATLFEQGKTGYRGRLAAALGDAKKEVRYFAAIRCSSLKDRELNSKCVPILKEILARETQQELVNYASLALLRVDPDALAPAEARKVEKEPQRRGSDGRMFHLRIYEGGESTAPKVELDFPVSLAQLAIMALDEPTKAEIRKKGVDIDNIWESLNRHGSANILTIRSGNNILKLWIQ